MPRSDRDDRRPRIVTFLAAVNAAGFATTLLFRGLVSVRRLVPLPGCLTAAADRANAAVTYGFMIGDVLYSAPLLLAAAVGLWRLRSWAWLAAQCGAVDYS